MLDGVAKPVGIIVAVLIDRQQIQLVLALQDPGITVAQQQIVEKAQVKMSVVGQKQGVFLKHFCDIPADPGLGDAPLPDVLIGDARKLLDFGRHEDTGAQGHQLVIFPGDGGRSVGVLHNDGGKFNDLVPGKIQARGLCVEQHQPVVF